MSGSRSNITHLCGFKLAYANKIKESITSQEHDSCVLNKGKSALPPLFNGPEMLSSGLDKGLYFDVRPWVCCKELRLTHVYRHFVFGWFPLTIFLVFSLGNATFAIFAKNVYMYDTIETFEKIFLEYISKRYTNADLKTSLYVRVHIKTIP